MATGVQSIRLAFLIILISLSNSLAWRNYDLILTDINCIVNDNYVVDNSCTVDRSPPYPRLNMNGQMVKQVKDFRLDFFVDLKRPNKDTISLLRITCIEPCTLFAKRITSPILKMFGDRMRKAGSWPMQCPIPADFHFKFQNFSLDTEYLPKYVPETEFKAVINMNDGKITFWQSTTLGRIERRNRNKGRKNLVKSKRGWEGFSPGKGISIF